jgi:hypothetical protein
MLAGMHGVRWHAVILLLGMHGVCSHAVTRLV